MSQTEIDSLTGLPLLHSLYGRIAENIENGHPVGFIFFDIMQFRLVIRNYGRQVADSILARFGEIVRTRLPQICRGMDVLAVPEREDDRFVLLLLSSPRYLSVLNDITVRKTAQRVHKFFNSIISELATEFKVNAGLEFHCGHSLIPADKGVSIERLVREAQREAYLKGELDEVMITFVSNVTHELRTPLTCIKGYTENLLDGAIENKELAYKWLGIISEEANRLERLINDLLDISMIEAQQVEFQREEVDLVRLVRHTIEVLSVNAEKEQITIDFSYPPQLPELMLDSDRISQVVFNLIDNAIKYSPPHSQIKVSILQPSPSLVRVDVSDHGPGIPPNKIQHIFERFYRANRGGGVYGRGLGLAIAKCIAEAHGGTISVESTLGEGSTFSLALPLNGSSLS